MNATQHQVSRGSANRLRAMGIGKEHALPKELVHVRCLGLRMTGKRTLPVIQIIHGNKKDIRFRRREHRRPDKQGSKEKA